MLRNLYITAIEPGSGKSLVLLGIMELLSKRVEKLGFFRPVIHDGDRMDNDIALIRSRYQLDCPYEWQYALTRQEAQQFLANGQFNELLKRVVETYKTLERECDFVVCEGVDPTNIDPAYVDNFDTQVANHLSAPLLIVVNGFGKSIDEIVGTVRSERETFSGEGCAIVATVVNRVAPDDVEDVSNTLKDLWVYSDPVFVLPEEESLSKPTIAEVAEHLKAEIVYGEESQFSREVLSIKAVSMQIPNFLDHLQEGGLVIAGGDRADVVLGCFASTFSENYPTIAGMILTGGLELAPQIRKLINGVNRWTFPLFTVETDTYETATKVYALRGEITPDNDRKIASALGIFESHVDLGKLQERIAVSRSNRITPIMFEYELIERARSHKQHIVLPEGEEERILRASEILLRRNVVELTLLGNEQIIREKIASLGLNLESATIIDPMQSAWHEDYAATYFALRKHKGITEDFAHDVMQDVSYFGTMMVHKDLADGMVSGSVHTTAHTIRPAFEFIRTLSGVSIVSSVFLMCLADRVLVYGDCAVNPNPNPQELADIAISSAATAETFGIEPLIAMLSYSTGESGKGADVDKVKEATRLAQELRPDLQIEGPIQYDAAIDESVAKTKLPDSKVAGRATVFIFPDLNTGNNTYKAVQRSANAVAIGPVLQGLKKPVNDLSRGCTVTDIVNTVAITAIQAQAIRQNHEASH